MTKGGFQRESRIAQDLAEIQVGAVVYEHLDDKEDALVTNLLTWLRGVFAALPTHLAQIDRWEQSWRAADRSADTSVTELGALAIQAGSYLA